MSRQPRAGTAGKLVGIRATDDERTVWERAARAEECPTLSAWIVKTLNLRAACPVARRGGMPAISAEGAAWALGPKNQGFPLGAPLPVSRTPQISACPVTVPKQTPPSRTSPQALTTGVEAGPLIAKV